MKPVATFTRRKIREPQNRLEQLEIEEETEKQLMKKYPDEISKKIKASFFVTNYSFPFLIRNVLGVAYTMTVDRYYPEKKTAIDYIDSEEKKSLISLKKKILKENGIKYCLYCDGEVRDVE